MHTTKMKKLSAIIITNLAIWPLIPSHSLAAQTVNNATSDKQQAKDEASVEKIIITGSRQPKAANKIPGAINVISQEEVSRNLSLTSDATSLLTRTIPGYSESTQQMSNSGETLRGRVALRLFDGVPQGSPLREGNRAGIFTDMGIIERVEVINGPSASEGVGAAGGIINYISRTPKVKGTEVTLSSQYRTQFEDDSESWRLGFNVAHLEDNYDLVLAASFAETGIGYDADGRRIGLGTSGSAMDSESDNLFVKVGTNFGKQDEQRLELSLSRFNIAGKGNYILVDGDRETGLSSTSERGRPLGARASFNDFSQQSLTYTHDDLFGGAFWVQYYRADQGMRYEAENSIDKQDPLIAPIALDENGLPSSDFPLIDQSEIHSDKEGFRSSWTKLDILGVRDLELQVGLDVVKDTAQQLLALTNRVWVPPMEYTSKTPFFQLSYDLGDVTVTGGVRREDGELKVDDYTTTWYRDRREVSGGKLDYQETLTNIGAIWRVTEDLSVYVSTAEGFTLPNVGIPLRNISCSNDTSEGGVPFGGTQPDGCPDDDPISVDGILDLQPIVVKNKEIGFNWNGESANIGASYYQSDSEFGVSLRVDPETEDYIMLRRPTEISGYEMSAGYKVTDTIKLNLMYSHTEGDTRDGDTGPLDRAMGVRDVGPDKVVLTADWQFSDAGRVVLGARSVLDNDINEGRAGEEHIKGYTLFDLNANYQLDNSTFTVGIDNLLDKSYFLSHSQVDQWRNYFKGQGRIVSLGYTLKF
ncbi:TonB-dependent receptor [Paraglaciecola sp. 20A4]|uniref:TonB-dependent receptor n=1 Tax=Paraglaciecola sp. 20A4 TaxID=2687288 RepID=UPI00140C3D07|nr:TonB-dependent receptor [Paraglaciecola sp. 20A4]